MAGEDNKVYGFGAGEVKRIGDTVRAFETGGELGGGVAPQPGQATPVIWAKLTSRDTTDKTLYAFAQQRRDGTSYAAITNGITGTIAKLPAVAPDAARDLTNLYVPLARGIRKVGSDVKPCWYVLRPKTSLVYVTLTSPSGSAGSTSAAAAYTYTASDVETGDSLGSGIAVEMQRGVYKVHAATHGIVRWDDGTTAWKLVWCDETPDLKTQTVVTSVACDNSGNVTGTTVDLKVFQ